MPECRKPRGWYFICTLRKIPEKVYLKKVPSVEETDQLIMLLQDNTNMLQIFYMSTSWLNYRYTAEHLSQSNATDRRRPRRPSLMHRVAGT